MAQPSLFASLLGELGKVAQTVLENGPAAAAKPTRKRGGAAGAQASAESGGLGESCTPCAVYAKSDAARAKVREIKKAG